MKGKDREGTEGTPRKNPGYGPVAEMVCQTLQLTDVKLLIKSH